MLFQKIKVEERKNEEIWSYHECENGINTLSLIIKIIQMNYKHGPSYSLTISPKKTIHDMHDDPQDNPGHQYNITGPLDRLHSTTMLRTSQRLPINHGVENTPGPDQYDPRPTSPHSPKVTFSKAKEINPELASPPCTWYKPEEKLVIPKVQSYSIGQKYPSILESQHKHPGPGHYQTPQPALKSKSQSMTSFPHTHRFHDMRDKTPGVGDYKIQSQDFLKGKQATIPKDHSYKQLKNSNPGPSDYKLKSQFEHTVQDQPGKSLSCRLKNQFETPNYTNFAFLNCFQKTEDTLKVLRASEKYSFGKSQRQLFVDSKTPGPTDYINDNMKPRNSFHSVIPKSKHEIKEDCVNNPGPGAYQIQGQNNGGYTIGKSKSMSNIADTPGVGRYNASLSSELKKRTDKKGNVFPKGKRTSFVSTNLAGVGDYQIAPPIKQAKLGFGKAQRFAKVSEPQPGPGDYHIHSILGYQHKSQNK